MLLKISQILLNTRNLSLNCKSTSVGFGKYLPKVVDFSRLLSQSNAAKKSGLRNTFPISNGVPPSSGSSNVSRIGKSDQKSQRARFDSSKSKKEFINDEFLHRLWLTNGEKEICDKTCDLNFKHD